MTMYKSIGYRYSKVKRVMPGSAAQAAYTFRFTDAQILAGMVSSVEQWQEVENAWFYQGGA